MIKFTEVAIPVIYEYPTYRTPFKIKYGGAGVRLISH